MTDNLAALRVAMLTVEQTIKDARQELAEAPATNPHQDHFFCELLNAVDLLAQLVRKVSPLSEEPALEHGTELLTPRSPRTLAEIETAAIEVAIDKHKGNTRAAALKLGIARSTLIRKLELAGLKTKTTAGAPQ